MDGESEADTQRAEAGRAEANVKREGLGSHEPARAQQPERPATGSGEHEAGLSQKSLEHNGQRRFRGDLPQPARGLCIWR